MRDLEVIADRVEIEALRGEFTDAAMMRDYGRLATLFTADGVLRIPDASIELAAREKIRAWGERVPRWWTSSCRPRTRARSGSTATQRPAGRTCPSSSGCATAART